MGKSCSAICGRSYAPLPSCCVVRCILRILPFCFPRISALYSRLTRLTANCLFLVIYTRLVDRFQYSICIHVNCFTYRRRRSMEHRMYVYFQANSFKMESFNTRRTHWSMVNNGKWLVSFRSTFSSLSDLYRVAPRRTASYRVVPRRDATIIWNVMFVYVYTGSTGLITPLWKLETSCKN